MLFIKFVRRVLRAYYRMQVKLTFQKANVDLKSTFFGAEVLGPFVVICLSLLSIGNGSSISGRLYINALGGVQIARCCHIAQGLTIYSHNHNWRSEKSIPYDEKEILRPVKIGDAVWIGANVTIALGSSIGNGVIVSSGSVVFGEVPDCAIVRGTPASVIGYRDQEIFQKLYAEGKMV